MKALRRCGLAAAVAAAMALIAAGCGSSNNGTSTTAASSATTTSAAGGGGGQNLELAASPSGQLSFDKTQLSAKAGTVTLTMSNPSSSGVQHGIAIEGNGVDQDGQIVQPGGTSTVTVSNLKPGKYEFYCPFDSHKQQGMEGNLTVK